jgi:cellulose biosynthesis protein BcsQ
MHTPRKTAQVLVFGSVRGGTGATTVAAHVASALARSGRPALLVDLQRRHPALRRARRALDGSATSAARPAPEIDVPALAVAPNLWFVGMDGRGSGPRGPLARLIEAAAAQGTWIVLDSPGDIDVRRDLAIEPVAELQVLRADATALANLECLFERPDVQVVLNQFDPNRPMARDVERMLSSLLGKRLVARVRFDRTIVDRQLADCGNLTETLPLAGAAADLAELADRLAQRHGRANGGPRSGE